MKSNPIKIFLCVLIFCLPQTIFGQKLTDSSNSKTKQILIKNIKPLKLKIRLVDDSDRTSVPFAQISIINSENKRLFSNLTNPSGECIFTVVDTLSGKIKIIAKSLGYQQFISNYLVFNNLSDSLQEFRIHRDVKQLKEVQVFQKKIVTNGEKIIYNVIQDQFSTATATAELFPMLPGVSISSNGEIKLNGKIGVLILIDGKGELKPQSEQLALLSNLSADQVDRIEIISSPSARYDANVTSVINIITKKVKGFSNLRSTYSQPLFKNEKNFGTDYITGGVGANLNFLIGSVRAAFNISTGNSTDLENTVGTRVINGLWKYYETDYANNYSFNIRPNLDLDYDINKHSSIGLNTDMVFNPSYIRSTNSTYNFYNYNSNKLDSIVSASNNYLSKLTRITITGSYKNRLDSLKDSYLYVTMIYAGNAYNQGNNLNVVNNSIAANFLENNLSGRFDIYNASIIFSNLLKKKYVSTEFGLKSNTLFNSTTQSINNNLTNFNYSEQLSSIFLSAKWKFAGFSLTTEIRNEFLNSVSKFQTQGLQIVSTDYNKLYPNIFIQRALGQNVTINLDYSEKVKRPLASYLNPSETFNDYYDKTIGNLSYKPVYYQRLEGQILYKNLGFTIYYDRSINERTLLPTNDPLVFTTTNLGIFNDYGFSLSQSFNIKNWFTSNSGLDFSYTNNGNENIIYPRNSWYNFNFNTFNEFTVNKRTRIDITFNYNSNAYSPYGIFGHFISSSITLRKLFFKDNLSVNAGMSDPFGIKKLFTENDFAQQFFHGQEATNDRTFLFQLIYKFKLSRKFNKQAYKNNNNGEIRY